MKQGVGAGAAIDCRSIASGAADLVVTGAGEDLLVEILRREQFAVYLRIERETVLREVVVPIGADGEVVRLGIGQGETFGLRAPPLAARAS